MKTIVYNKATGRIIGITDPGSIQYRNLASTGTASIDVTDEIADAVRLTPMQYRIDAGRLARTGKDQVSAKSIAAGANAVKSRTTLMDDISIDGRTYCPDTTLFANVSLALGVCVLDQSHTIKLWCKDASNTWTFLDHDMLMLVELAKAFNQRREEVSQSIYM